MAVLSYREVTGSTLSQRLGEPPVVERRFVATLDGPTSSQAVAAAIGVTLGSAAPGYSYLSLVEASVTQGQPTPFHAEVTLRYEWVPNDEEGGNDPNPLARPDVWSFSVGGASVPALFYFDGDQQKPLVNSAGDFFEGLTTDEAEVRATISANRAQFPLSLAAAVTNCVNASGYLGAPKHHWKCLGISGEQQVEIVNDVPVRYWAITSELAYRQTGWNLLLPDVGYNYLEGGQKKRAWVRDPDDAGTRIPAVSPQALNNDGSLKPEGDLPDILTRRVNREVNFAAYFGSPSF